MRLFLALNLPDAEQARLAGVLATLEQSPLPFRWVESEALHITLKFLGQVEEDRLAAIRRATRAALAGISPFDVDLDGFGAFPSRARARVIWLGVAAPPVLTTLQQNLEQHIEPLGFPREPRPFHPHITLGRARPNAGHVDAAALDRITGSFGYKARIRIDAVDLMRSHTGSRGARYERIERNGLSD
ncbi:MAG: RNA 2',3'-cyclic phosphodiesterase [Gemmatimonadota bacterium]